MQDGKSVTIPAHEWLRRNKEPLPFDREAAGLREEAKQGFAAGMFVYIDSNANGLWNDPDSADRLSNPQDLTKLIGDRYSELYALAGEDISSPIEWRLGACMLWMDCDWAGLPSVDFLGGPKEHLKAFGPGPSPCGVLFYIQPQAKVAGYKVDFLVYFLQGSHYAGVAVECDGHDFHEKTKEQASRDKARDRAILAEGFPVVRFSGSDIYRDASNCVEQIKEILIAQLERLQLIARE